MGDMEGRPDVRSRNLKHGCSYRGGVERLYKAWLGMRNRCRNPRNRRYGDYGGRGIRVCEEWSDYAVFRAYLTALPHYGEEGRTLDRIDNDGDYQPGNV